MSRKRNWDSKCFPFPREPGLQVREASLRPVGAAAALSEDWLRCGEGFQDTSGASVLTAEKKTLIAKHLELSPQPKEENFKSNNVDCLANITWSSSGSDLSDEEKAVSKTPRDELQFIDWDIGNNNEHHEFEEGESPLDISDCASCASSSPLKSEQRLSNYPKINSTEILEYSSDSGKEDDTENILFIDSESPHKCNINFASNSKQVLENPEPWMKSTETILCTPPKKINKFPRPPEDSAKKKKPIRGGLAERLSELQNRERSAISFWRHQCAAYQKTLKGREPGLLIVKILELHEECTIQVAFCEQLERLQSDSPLLGLATRPRVFLKVLFTKETAEHLKGRPQDIVHIYPPWQKLVIPNESYPVVLNTYCCQKVIVKEDSQTTGVLYGQGMPLKRKNISLAQMFNFMDLTPKTQVTCSTMTTTGTDFTLEQEDTRQHFSAHITPSHSLLDVVRSQGTPAKSGVRVVVQRAYMLPCRDGTSCASCTYRDQPHGRETRAVRELGMIPSRNHCGEASASESRRVTGLGPQTGMAGEALPGGAAPLELRRDRSMVCVEYPGVPAGSRTCLLVQDAYGLFGEVHLEDTTLKEKHLEGKSCSLVGVKVLQKATRERTVGLFSLIDTIWPPVIPEKTLGQSQPCEEVQADMPPPNFCYILTLHPNLGQIDIIEEDPVSKLYKPPVCHCLKEILQASGLGMRCTFYGRVIYQRPQLKSFLLMQPREIWLVVTDTTLQRKDESCSDLPRTVSICVTPSCVLGPEVLEALTVAAPHNILFRDALQDRGHIVCVERSVLLLPKPPLSVASGACASDLTGPVMLDELSSRTQEYSLCSVQGTVASVDKSTAFSWPACDHCGNGELEQSPEHRGGTFYCSRCTRVVTSPVLRRHLQVYLNCPSRLGCSVKVKLLQSSISSLLQSATSEDGSYEVKSVLGKEVGPLSCFVWSTASYPTSFTGLEEVQLLHAGVASASHPVLSGHL
ncbi:PREDICTED: DNA repair-scaffolding protein-like [Elephantulus edwardii]|uniref:DNA repair-scaffolding protein-like n=1 Tax=Elephantulus edwardii TaxID=28737 RepID=UPI0003F0615D|nr:PREDICTED: DNA repair-scaffolding protein-like [Elephantulus edwardii]